MIDFSATTSIPPISPPEDHQVHWFVMRSLTNLIQMESNLQQAGFTCFLPKGTRMRGTLTRRRMEVVPIVPPYIFVRSTYEDIRAFKSQYDRLSFTRVLGSTGHSTMKVPDKEMEDFIRVVTQQEEKAHIYRAGEIMIPTGQHIRICGGSLDGVEGLFVKIQGSRDKRLVVRVGGIMLATTPVDKTLIQLIR